jgi:hypothetical protein
MFERSAAVLFGKLQFTIHEPVDGVGFADIRLVKLVLIISSRS